MNKKHIGRSLESVLTKELKDQEFRFYFERSKAIGEIARIVRTFRLNSQMTQQELASKAKTSQTVIARLESGKDTRLPSLEFLERIAKALKARLLLSFEYEAAA